MDTPRKVAGATTSPTARAVNSLIDLPLARARQVDVELAVGDDLLLAHGLGRPVRGFLLVYSDQPIAGHLHEDMAAGVDRSTHLALALDSVGDVRTRAANLSFLVW